MRDAAALVYVVDDDSSAREGVARLIRSAGLLTRHLQIALYFLRITKSRYFGDY
jgi:FixJ family two-component response regulator